MLVLTVAVYAIAALILVNFLCFVFGALVPSEHARSVLKGVSFTISFLLVLLLIVILVI